MSSCYKHISYTQLWDDFEQIVCVAAYHTASRHCNSCIVTRPVRRSLTRLCMWLCLSLLICWATVQSVALISLLHTWFSAHSLCVCVCVRSLSKHMTFTHGLEYCVSVGLLGSLRNHMERLCTAADPRVTARPQRCVSLLFHHTLSVHTTPRRAPRARGLARKNDITTAVLIASARLWFTEWRSKIV